MSDSKFLIDYSKRASKCKKCKAAIEKGSKRLGKLVPNAFGESDSDMKQYYHIDCLFDSFKRTKASTKIIESVDDILGFDKISQKDKDFIIEKIACIENWKKNKKFNEKPKKNLEKCENDQVKTDLEQSDDENFKKRKIIDEIEIISKKQKFDSTSEDNKFETFQKICNKVALESSHLKKSSVLRQFFKDGINQSKLIKFCLTFFF